MDWLEKEPASSDGTRYIRENPEDGKGGVVAWSEGPSFMCIRGSDGKLLGTCIKY